MRTFIYIFLVLFPGFVIGNNQNNDYGSIRGFVSTSDGYPAVYVSVLIKNTGKGIITGDNGNFEFKKIKPGTYMVRFSMLEHTYFDTTIEVTQNETIFLKIQLRSTVAELKKVIVAANFSPNYVATKPSESLRLDVPLIEVPQNITVIPHQLLSDQGLVSMSEAIRNVSGVTKFYGVMNDYSLIIRGFWASVNVFRNGVGGYWWNQQEDAAMLEKIEFVKGPAGFMFSMAEPGGIVNNVTKQPTRDRIATVEEGFGSFNLLRLSTDLGGALSKSGKLCYRFNAGVHKQDRAFQFGKAARYFICAALRYEPNKKTAITAEFNYMYGKTSGNNDGLPALNGKMFQLPGNFAIAGPGSTGAIIAIDNYYRLKFKHEFNDNWNLNVQVASVHGPWGGYSLNSDGSIPVSNDTLYRVSSYDHYINYSNPSEAFMDGKFHTGRKIEHKVLLGVDYYYYGSKGRHGDTWGEKRLGIYIPSPDYYVPPDSLRNFVIGSLFGGSVKRIGLYMQDHIKIAGKLVVTLAGRLTHATTDQQNDWTPDDQKKTTDNVFTPRAGLTWLFGDNASVYALYDQCFLPQTGRNYDNKLFKPVTGFNIETGLKSYFFNKKLNINLSVFNIVRNNGLTPDPLHINYWIETGQAISKGFEIDMMGYITPALIVSANYGYSDATITKDTDPNIVGGTIIGMAPHRGNLWLNYKLLHRKLKGMSFGMGYQYGGKRRANNIWDPDKTKFLPGYNLLDAAVSYRNEHFNISFNIYNIININYATTGFFDQSGGWRYTPGEPINFRLSFSVNLIHQKKEK
ncbi:MAG: TonB-dependent siderophore receptor [Ferruginibacter sp.]